MTATLGAVTAAVLLALGAPDGGAAQPATEATAVPLVPSRPAAPPLTTANARAAARSEHAQAMARLRAGSYSEAAELFTRAAARDPGNAALATDLGFALGRAGRRAEAEAVLRGAIEKDPHRHYAYVNLADLLADDPARWERRDAVIAFLDKGLEALKDDRKGRFNLLLGLAGFERAVGRTAAARARLQPLLGSEAPPFSRAQRKRVLDLLDTIALDERAHALEDWPAPAPATARRLAAEAGRFEAAERVDEAMRDLEIAVNLAPSNAEAWRALGRLLAAHGGALELDRADEALRQALTLEPAWSDLRELRAQLARRRAVVSAPPPRSAPPSEHARALYQEAEEWIDVGDPIGMGRDLVEEALADSPGFVAAALSLYALGGTVPQATIDALYDDGPGLWALADGVRKLGKVDKTDKTDKSGAPAADGDALVGPWIDRAVALDVQEARFARALTRAVAGDRAGALADLVAYVAREPNPAHLAEARALRAGLGERGDPSERNGHNDDTHLSPRLLARIRLLEDRPDAALRALGGSCTRRAASQTAWSRSGWSTNTRINEPRREAATRWPAPPETAARSRGWRASTRGFPTTSSVGGSPAARAARPGSTSPQPGGRWPGWSSRRARQEMPAPPGPTPPSPSASRRRARRRPTAGFPRPRQRSESSPGPGAPPRRPGARGDGAPSLPPWRWRCRRSRCWSDAAGAAGPSRRRCESAPRSSPRWRARSPSCATTSSSTAPGVIGAALDPQVAPEEIARALTEPRPTSRWWPASYDRLVARRARRGVALAAARARAGLRRVDRASWPAPSCSPRVRRATTATSSARSTAACAASTPTRSTLCCKWARALASTPGSSPGGSPPSRPSARQTGHGWAAPALSLADLDVDFPVELDALSARSSATCLRNAQAAVDGRPEARVVIRVDRERDVTGRQWVTLLVGDSAPAALTLESIEARESGRGLAIVRDLVRAVARPPGRARRAGAASVKLVGASFPL